MLVESGAADANAGRSGPCARAPSWSSATETTFAVMMPPVSARLPGSTPGGCPGGSRPPAAHAGNCRAPAAADRAVFLDATPLERDRHPRPPLRPATPTRAPHTHSDPEGLLALAQTDSAALRRRGGITIPRQTSTSGAALPLRRRGWPTPSRPFGDCCPSAPPPTGGHRPGQARMCGDRGPPAARYGTPRERCPARAQEDHGMPTR